MSRPVTYRGRRVRALRIGDADDVELLTTISRGEFATAGFRNRDLRRLLLPAKSHHARAASARVTRQLRLLRAHGVIKKIPKTHRHRLTHHGHVLAAAVLASSSAACALAGDGDVGRPVPDGSDQSSRAEVNALAANRVM